MTNDQCRRHANINFLALELLLHHFLSLFRNGFQSIDEEACDAWYQFHHCTHRHTQRQYCLDVQLGSNTNEDAHNDTQHQRFAQDTKLLLQSLGIHIQFGKARNQVKPFVNQHSKGGETLAERLRNRDARQVIMGLKLLGSQVSHNKRDNIANDGSEIAPCQRLTHHKVSHSTDKGEMPIIPEINVYGTCTFSNKEQEVDTKQNRDNQGAYGRIVSHSGSSRPSHVKHLQRPLIEVGYILQRRGEIICQQFRNHIESHETNAHIETTFERLAKLHANAQADNSK